ncbi:Protein of unknown function [Geoalkalibacter ferrihydriticus]|uniref:Outer membrane lipoprotein-sorting protein n=2 Tax=Geoalkalibacter ferrihydriticus TaxID=392333 RepID=A0A0C2HI88_9BACT|nr:DUF1329 domain-containing protein [Geoalkalibacter ferrihydriticus]KIH76681.1 hypothetical protein GFER_11055 [Geoalkalibacter ferrihydriticus DSM 17813]SDM06344.1 Protein of unknown function [Geoalkalibacter ferrihydriticus]
MFKQTFRLLGALFLVLGVASFASAQLLPEEIARLGNDLTPLGAEKAGNADGTIPPWTGGLTAPPAGYQKGDHHPDPFADDAILFTITAENMGQHADKLTVGHKAMLETYPSFHMNVYPTRRSAAVPQRIYEATREVAATARLVNDGDGVAGAVVGIPFPIPKSGIEVIWNHLLRFRGEAAQRRIAQAAVTRGGNYTLVQFKEEYFLLYAKEGITEEELGNRILFFKQEVTAPARLAGEILLVHETLDQVREPRSAWVYNPGQRRVRRAPNVAYDNPGTASDGIRTNDQFDMFNGATDRYNWELVGKKEIYVPYNSYKLHSNRLKYSDILTPLHVNPEHLRYELHRVWVVDATLKDGARHLYKRRTFYVDEDSWQILAVDIYDNRDQLWRVSEGHVINYYEVPTLWTTLEVHTDLQSGRYLAVGLNNESTMFNFDVRPSLSDFAPGALRRGGTR